MLFFNKIFSNKNDAFETRLKKILKFPPKNITVYKEAFTHKSSHEKDKHGIALNYERLEFLGDAVLNVTISEYLYEKMPFQKEGKLTQMRAKIVSRKHLNEIGKGIGLEDLVKIHHHAALGKDASGDLYESLIGAIYVDYGLNKAKSFIHQSMVKPFVDIKQLENRIISYKSLMIEWCQKEKKKIEYNTFEESNAMDVVVFVSVIRINDQIAAKGRGNAKKEAEETASKRAFYKYEEAINKNK